ncbi:MAG: carboxypeptidase regulatory-like domain-containing protein, partial [Acidobacteriaceae bacterium]|nr:carboxypeptidase regulatory-like domain-containing protein [Acidobacteriaceae bacterium]
MQTRFAFRVRILPRKSWIFAFLALLLFPCVRGWTQEVTAAVNGSVTDPSGGAIAGAKVIAKDMDRGTTYSTTTGSNGIYSLPRLPIGRYEVRAENTGFEAAVRPDVVLVLNQVAKIDFQLQVGSVSQTVEVTGAPPILQTESTQLGTVIDARTNAQLPLATRNYNQLTLLSPGAVTTNPAAFQGAQSTFGSGRPQVNGNREQANFYLLDGIDNNQISENDVGYAPSVDAIQEFNLISNNASAEFGNFMGGIISVSLKSGTNRFHGTAFEFLRNDKLNANTWSNNWNGDARPKLRWNEFGGTFGGPIIKDRLFFFGDYQGSRFDQPATATPITTLTNAERSGNFSAICAAGFTNGICNNPAQQIFNPYTDTNGSNRQPFLNNMIPGNLLSPVATQIVSSSLFPATTNNNLTQNALNTQRNNTNSDQGDLKIDWNPTDKDHAFGRFTKAVTQNPITNSQPLLNGQFNNYPLYNGVLDWTRSVGPSIVNDMRGGVQYYPVSTGFDTLKGSGLPALPGGNPNYLPGFFFAGGNINTGSSSAGASGPAFGSPAVTQIFSDTNIQAEDTLILTKGRHTMRAGFQYFRQRLDIFYSGNEGLGGDFNFNGQYTQNVVGGTPVGGLPEADFMLGLPFNLGIGAGAGTVGQRSSIYSTFFQDDWRLNEHLTLNLGLRWELHTPWDEVRNRQTNFQEFTGQVLLSGKTNVFNDNNALYNQYNGITNFQPRIGLAWTPFGNSTVIRASYTLSGFVEGTGTNLRLFRNPPWQLGHNVTYTATQNGGLPLTTLTNGFNFSTGGGTPCTVETIGSYPASCFKGATIFTWDPNERPAVSNQWNFSIQHQFGNATTLQVAYVGQRNTHLVVPVNASQGYLNPHTGTVQPSLYLAGNPALVALAPTDKLTNTTGIQ